MRAHLSPPPSSPLPAEPSQGAQGETPGGGGARALVFPGPRRPSQDARGHLGATLGKEGTTQMPTAKHP